MSSAESDPSDPTHAAQARVTEAYAAARRGVYDLLPSGAIAMDLLSSAQRGMLVELEVAEQHLLVMRYGIPYPR